VEGRISSATSSKRERFLLLFTRALPSALATGAARLRQTLRACSIFSLFFCFCGCLPLQALDHPYIYIYIRSDSDFADHFGIHKSTLCLWKDLKNEFLALLKDKSRLRKMVLPSWFVYVM
jgi:hypothetical protein